MITLPVNDMCVPTDEEGDLSSAKSYSSSQSLNHEEGDFIT